LRLGDIAIARSAVPKAIATIVNKPVMASVWGGTTGTVAVAGGATTYIRYDCKPLFPHSGINFLQVFFEQKLLPNFYVLFC